MRVEMGKKTVFTYQMLDLLDLSEIKHIFEVKNYFFNIVAFTLDSLYTIVSQFQQNQY